MPLALVEKLPSALRGHLGLALFATFGIAASLATAWIARQADDSSLARDFHSRIELRHAFFQQSLLEYENALFALRLVGRNNRSLEPEEFMRAAEEIYIRKPGVYAIQWVPVVGSGELDALVSETRRLIDPGFGVKYRLPDGTFAPLAVPAPGDKLHAVITYVYPREGNESAIGYDILTGPTAAQLAATRANGRIALTPPVQLVQGFEGVVLTSYIVRRDGPAMPPLNSDGYFQIVLNLRQLLRSLWTRSPTYNADFALYDYSVSPPLPLYAHYVDSAKPAANLPFEAFRTPETVTREIRLGGRTWLACYRPHAAWQQARRSETPLLLLYGGLLLTVLALAYLRLLLVRTERIRSEVAERTRELSESRAFLDAIISQTPSAIWVKDADLRYRLANEEFCRTHQIALADIMGKPASALFPPDEAEGVERIDREILSTGRALHYEDTYQVAQRRRTYLVAKFPLRSAGGSIYAVGGVATDVTERRLAESNRAAVERRLLESQKLESLGVLAGGIAHDFNNLLTGILGQANLCRLQLPPHSPQQHSLAQIELASQRAAELCQQMLAYSGRGRFTVQPVELGALVRETLPLLSLSLSKSATLDCQLAADLPCVEADVTQLRQIIMNLVMNASEALGSDPGSITVRTRLVPGTAALFATCIHAPELPEGDYVCLEVSDTGCGMSTETLDRIFDPFFTTKFTGRGLGLAAVLGITRGHRGALGVTTQPDHGSTFRLYLPASSNHVVPRALAHSTAATTIAATTGTPRPILLVDDETSVREIAAAILTNLGYEVKVACDGHSGLAALRAYATGPTAAVVDLTMPGLPATEFLAAARLIRPDLPILFISGYSEHDAAPLLAHPRTAFLAKPFSVAALREKLARLLAG